MSTTAQRYPTTLSGQLRRRMVAYLVGAGLLLTQQGLMFGRDLLFKRGVDAAARGDSEHAVQIVLVTVGAILLAAGVRIASRIVIFSAGRSVEYELRSELLARLHTLGPSFFRKIPTGDILSRATNDLTQVRLLLGFGILNIVNTVFALVSALGLMLSISPKVTGALLAMFPVLLFATQQFSRKVFLRSRESGEAFGKLADRVQASLSAVRVVRAMGIEEREIAAFEKASASHLEKGLALAKLRGLMFPIMGMIGSVGTLVVVGYGAHLQAKGELTKGDVVALWAGLQRLLWPMAALGFVTAIVSRGRAGYERLRAIYDAEPDVADDPKAKLEKVEGHLTVSHLSFALGERKVLDDVSFDVPAGTSLAIVGRTAAGKSLLSALLPRLLPTPKGAVFLDGVDVTELPLRTLRGAIGYAQQDAFLFSTTVGRNIAFSVDAPDSPDAVARTERAAREASIAAEVAELPDGFDTVVGERGVQLSGGQRQRVALARAFLWEPKVLLLDDPLSAVDAKTEARILESIDEKKKDRTVLLVTHRIAAASRCDRIVVLADGKVAQEGTHDELVKQPGLYAELAEEQRVAGELDKLGAAQ